MLAIENSSVVADDCEFYPSSQSGIIVLFAVLLEKLHQI